MPPVLVPIVEGHAEVEAVPVLVRRLLAGSGRQEIRVARPVRVKRLTSSFVMSKGFLRR